MEQKRFEGRALIRAITQVAIIKLKRDLSSYRSCLHRIDCNLDHIQELRSLATKVTVTYREAPGSSSPTSDKSGIIVNIRELEDAVLADSQQMMNEYIRIRYLIDSLDNFRDRQVLQEKYINGHTWSQISSNIYIEERWVRRIHNRALRRLLKKMTLLSPPLRMI